MLYLASFLDQPVRGKTNEIIGRLEDLIVRVGEDLYPPITGLSSAMGAATSSFRQRSSNQSTASPDSSRRR